MSKYYLVASYYDMYQRNYKNEIVLNLPTVDLSTIQAIDYYTSSHTSQEIFNQIEQTMGVKGLNHLSIKYYKNKYAKPSYSRTIENDPDFLPCTQNITSKAPVVSSKIELFQKEKSQLLNLLEKRDLESFQANYPFQDQFSFLVTRWINASYDEPEAEQEELKNILLEFSRYETFRGWIVVAKSKQKFYQKVVTRKSIINPVSKSQPLTVKSISDYEEEYQKKFAEQNKVSYGSYQTYQYNTSHLEEDKEEFLEEQEVNQLYETSDTNESYFSKIKRKHH